MPGLGKTVPEQTCRINLNLKSEKSSSYRNKVIQWNSLTRFLSTISATLPGLAGLNRSCLDFQYRCKLLARLGCVKIFRNVNHVNNNISSKYKGSWQHVKIPPASPHHQNALGWAEHESFQASPAWCLFPSFDLPCITSTKCFKPTNSNGAVLGKIHIFLPQPVKLGYNWSKTRFISAL